MIYSMNSKKNEYRIIRDSCGSKIGTLKVLDGRQIVIDVSGEIKGIYCNEKNVTTDGAGIHIGTGNLLLSVLKSSIA